VDGGGTREGYLTANCFPRHVRKLMPKFKTSALRNEDCPLQAAHPAKPEQNRSAAIVARLLRVAGVRIFWRVLLRLRRHFCGAFLARHAARAELLALNVLFREYRFAAVYDFQSIRDFSLRWRMRVSASSFDWTTSDQSLVRASLLSLLSSSSCACVGFSMFPP